MASISICIALNHLERSKLTTICAVIPSKTIGSCCRCSRGTGSSFLGHDVCLNESKEGVLKGKWGRGRMYIKIMCTGNNDKSTGKI